MSSSADDEMPKHRSRNQATSESKLRRDGRHCPVCLEPLGKIASRTRSRRECTACGAHPQAEKVCRKCGARALWESKRAAACGSCGAHGDKTIVIG